MLYCLDTNVFIQAYHTYYAMDIAPGFWDILEKEISKIRVPQMVFEEIKAGREDDALRKWFSKLAEKTNCVEQPDDDIYAAFTEISSFVEKNYEPQHSSEFLSGADPWVIAHAKAKGYIVITMEAPKNEQRDKNTNLVKGEIKIPNICQYFNVRYENTYWMLRKFQAQFVLPTK